MKLRSVAALLFLASLPAVLPAADLVLAAKEKSDYQIVLPDKYPTPAVGEALAQTARLMQTAFLANGVAVPVVAEAKRDAAKPAIYLGDTAFARGHKVDLASLPGWGYVHKVVGRDVIVAGRDHPTPDRDAAAGGRPRSMDRVATAKGVVDFLRQYAGVRFLFPDLAPWAPLSSAGKIDLLNTPAIEYLKTPTIGVPADLDVRVVPPLEYHISYPLCGGFYEIANNRFPVVDEAIGAHTYEEAVPRAKFKDTHPEYFALIGGKRTANEPGVAQYCLSNPAVRELIYQNMVAALDRGYRVVYLGQPDGFRPCQCDDCKKLYDTGNDWDEKLWLAHRDLAERVRKARPDKQVTILSYIQTEVPPKTFKKFPDNTAVLLTGTNEEDIAPWRSAEVPKGFAGSVYNWCPNMATRYTPMRTPRFVEEQAKRLAANRIRSIYRDGTGVLFGLDGPVYYTMGRMFDDVAHNQAKVLVAEYCEAAFGKAAGPMVQFFDHLYHSIELYSSFLGTRDPAWTYKTIYGQRRKYVTDPFQFLSFLYSPTVLANLEAQLSQAEAAADSPKAKARLALVRREFNWLRSTLKVVHLYHAFQTQPDRASRDRLLDAIDARNAEINGHFDARGRQLPTAGGWAYTMFPPPGHDAAHMRLAHNGYQEPVANTAFNWDTAAMRTAPLPGTKRLAVGTAKGPVGLDAAEWAKATAAPLEGLAGSPATRKTAVRMLADGTTLYVRIEAELSAGADAVNVTVAPVPGREVAYRFTVGPKADSKQDSANGLVTDPIDPRYGKFDADWSGEWKYETRLDAATGRWLGLIAVPFKTLGVGAPKPGTFWRGNVTRTSTAGTSEERTIWSVLAGSKSLDDLNDLGELTFPADTAAAVNPLKQAREDLYRKSFEFPAEWAKLPDALPLSPWVFRKDELDQGVKQKWYEGDAKDGWEPIDVPAFWAETTTAGKLTGHGWYRTTFTVPAAWKGRPVRVLFGAVDEQAWVYVNGRLVREHTEKSEGKRIDDLWETPFAAEVPAAVLRYGEPNVLVVRVQNLVANGGIWRPVRAHAGPAK